MFGRVASPHTWDVPNLSLVPSKGRPSLEHVGTTFLLVIRESYGSANWVACHNQVGTAGCWMTFILRSQQCMLQVVMAAVAENGIALKYAAPELQEDCNLAVSGELFLILGA